MNSNCVCSIGNIFIHPHRGKPNNWGAEAGDGFLKGLTAQQVTEFVCECSTICACVSQCYNTPGVLNFLYYTCTIGFIYSLGLHDKTGYSGRLSCNGCVSNCQKSQADLFLHGFLLTN